MQISDLAKHKIEKAYYAGLSIRAAARFADVAKQTAHTVYRGLAPIQCPCGRQREHKGWCRYRVALSPARREFLFGFVPVRVSTIEHWNAMERETLLKCGVRPKTIQAQVPVAVVTFIKPLTKEMLMRGRA